eukprot:TRINITY_DN2487_c0_g2_i1.p1 TRINITY_DN2487_c0_g2~~TRINITY_DN2487_c0_g2_i1.p1  ORF type:complete len:164 (+),score=12.73 TRINITY_DN2487_c0_g2_i1:41-493(+)
MAVDSERYAYATLVTTDEYAIGAEVLLQSLKEFSSNAAIHRVVLITPNVSTSARARLQRVGWEVLEVVPLSMASCPSASDHVSGWAEVGYTKLRIWGLVQYTKIFYIGEFMAALAVLTKKRAAIMGTPTNFDDHGCEQIICCMWLQLLRH